MVSVSSDCISASRGILAQMFVVDRAIAEENKTGRSVQLSDSINKRLKSLEAEHGEYAKAAILNQLLDDGLKMYGF